MNENKISEAIERMFSKPEPKPSDQQLLEAREFRELLLKAGISDREIINGMSAYGTGRFSVMVTSWAIEHGLTPHAFLACLMQEIRYLKTAVLPMFKALEDVVAEFKAENQGEGGNHHGEGR